MPCHSQDFKFKQFKTLDCFSSSNSKKKKKEGLVAARLSANLSRSPLKLHMKQSLGIQGCFWCYDPPQTRNPGSAKHHNPEPMKEKREASTRSCQNNTLEIPTLQGNSTLLLVLRDLSWEKIRESLFLDASLIDSKKKKRSHRGTWLTILGSSPRSLEPCINYNVLCFEKKKKI